MWTLFPTFLFNYSSIRFVSKRRTSVVIVTRNLNNFFWSYDSFDFETFFVDCFEIFWVWMKIWIMRSDLKDTLSPLARLMALRGLSTRKTRRIFTTDIVSELWMRSVKNFPDSSFQTEWKTHSNMKPMSDTQTTSKSRRLNAERQKAPLCKTKPYEINFNANSIVNTVVKKPSKYFRTCWWKFD